MQPPKPRLRAPDHSLKRHMRNSINTSRFDRSNPDAQPGGKNTVILGRCLPKDAREARGLFLREARSTRARSALTDGAKRVTDARSAVASTRDAFLQCFEASGLKIFFAARASRAAERFVLVSTPQGRALLLPPGSTCRTPTVLIGQTRSNDRLASASRSCLLPKDAPNCTRPGY